MKSFVRLKFTPKSFSTRVFTYLLTATILIFGIYTVLSMYLQQRSLEREIIKDGMMLSQLLAENARLGVFTENHEILHSSLSAILPLEGIEQVSVLTREKQLLHRHIVGVTEKTEDLILNLSQPQLKIMAEVAHYQKPSFTEDSRNFEFWAPVLTGNKSFTNETLFFDRENPEPKESGPETIGFVSITMNKEVQKKGDREIILRSILCLAIFLAASIVLTWLIVREVSTPINQLVSKIKSYGVKLDTTDEMGFLSSTIDQMVNNLSESFATISSLKNGLEIKVRERTTELCKTNTELTETLQQLKDAQAQLVQSEKLAALGQLVAGIAHEVNNNINFISGALPPLKRTATDLRNINQQYTSLSLDQEPAEIKQKLTDIRQYQSDLGYEKLMNDFDILMANINEGTRRTSKIVEDLKNFSRPDESEAIKIDLNKNIDNTLALIQHEYKYNIEIERNYATNLPKLSCFPGQLNQVFMNILLNSIQAINGQGMIKIKTWQDDHRVHISFKDSGPGMSEEVKKKIFDPFFSTKEVGKGTGLGLSISYGIIKKHQGEIKVESGPNQGTEFEIILPLV
ncbi:MAG: GHKL domain-containing protein [Proteobacteria bacterium]|nr:GHKL domain-containing protein [Pseudomonadota bacterium]MBU1717152.1 GHKL domain-containing protein [Pseudomonadota bacterium]